MRNEDKDEFFDNLIVAMKRVKNCDRAYETLKYIQQNSYWNEEGRGKYGTVKDNWYDHMKSKIDECISLIEDRR